MATHEQEKQCADHQQFRADSLQKKSDDLYIANLRLQVEVDLFKHWYYGPRADRLSTTLELGQMLLAFGEEFDSKPINQDDLPKCDAAEEQPRRISRSCGRRNLKNFDKLPVQQHIHELSEAERTCPCCGKTRAEIGADESWQLEYYPKHFERLHHIRKKYARARISLRASPPFFWNIPRDKPVAWKSQTCPPPLHVVVAHLQKCSHCSLRLSRVV